MSSVFAGLFFFGFAFFIAKGLYEHVQKTILGPGDLIPLGIGAVIILSCCYYGFMAIGLIDVPPGPCENFHGDRRLACEAAYDDMVAEQEEARGW